MPNQSYYASMTTIVYNKYEIYNMLFYDVNLNYKYELIIDNYKCNVCEKNGSDCIFDDDMIFIMRVLLKGHPDKSIRKLIRSEYKLKTNEYIENNKHMLCLSLNDEHDFHSVGESLDNPKSLLKLLSIGEVNLPEDSYGKICKKMDKLLKLK